MRINPSSDPRLTLEGQVLAMFLFRIESGGWAAPGDPFGYANLIWPHLGLFRSFVLAPPVYVDSYCRWASVLGFVEVGEGDVAGGAV